MLIFVERGGEADSLAPGKSLDWGTDALVVSANRNKVNCVSGFARKRARFWYNATVSYREKKNRIEYMVTCVGDFARAHKMTPADAFSFLQKFEGLDFLSDCYDVEHSQSIDTAVDDLSEVCMRNGGVFA